METRRVGWTLVVRQNAEAPSDVEWDRFLQLLGESRPDFERLRVLVVTDGGGPDAPQRARLAATLGGKLVRAVIVTDSTRVRFIGSVIALFHRDLRSFRAHELRQAYVHIGLKPDEVAQVERSLAEMSERIARGTGSAPRA